jgi:hypothetical protein
MLVSKSLIYATAECASHSVHLGAEADLFGLLHFGECISRSDQRVSRKRSVTANAQG